MISEVMTDICSVCAKCQEYGTMSDITEEGFDLICDDCLEKNKIIWALEYVKSNMDHIEELADSWIDPRWILSEEEVDKIIEKVKEKWQIK
jgi:hypothetical protein